MSGIDKSIEERINDVKTVKSNCFGTALYILGEVDSYKPLSRQESREAILKMKRVKDPKSGYLVSWESQGIPFHAGVVIGEDSFHVLHRNHNELHLVDSSLKEFNDFMFKHMGINPTYRIPNKFYNNLK